MTAEDRSFWNPAVEQMPREELRALQLERLKEQIAYNFERSPFFRTKFEQAGAAPGDIRSFGDFSRLPLMTKSEHREAQARSLAEDGNPYSQLACAPPEEIVRINATSGTTGAPTLYTLTQHDVDVVNEMHARKYWRAGVRPGDVMLQAVALSMFTGGLPLSQGIMNMGACVVPIGVEGGTRRVLEFAELTKPKALLATPSFGRHLIEECSKHLGKPASELGFKWFFSVGEPGGGDPEIRTALSEGFGGAKIFDHTGGGHAFHAISADEPASEFSGMYMVSEDHCLLELVDPVTKAPVDIVDGAVGEMVWTFLDWRGGPFMRYAIGDVVQVWTSREPGKWPGLRFKITGRADDMLIVKGVNVYPQAIQTVVAAHCPNVTGAFRIVLDRPGPAVTPPLRIRLEYGEGIAPEDLPGLEAEIVAQCREQLRLTPELIWLAPGTLPREAMKTKLIEIESRETAP